MLNTKNSDQEPKPKRWLANATSAKDNTRQCYRQPAIPGAGDPQRLGSVRVICTIIDRCVPSHTVSGKI